MRAVNKSSINLVELNRPGILQHIASLTREDVTDPDSEDVAASTDRIHHLLEDSPTDCLTTASLARSRIYVETLSSPAELSAKDAFFSYLEASILLVLMNEQPAPSGWSFPSASAYCAPKQRVEVFLTEERLPEELGWKRSERKLGAMDFLPVMKNIYEEKRLQSGKGALWKALVPSFLLGADNNEL